MQQGTALPRNRITAHEVHHGERGHARGDAERNTENHQRGQHRIATQAAQTELEIV